MNAQTHHDLARFIWDICNLLRGPYKRNEYRKVILSLTVLRRFDCVLAPTKQKVLDAETVHKSKTGNVRRKLLEAAAGRPFYNTSKLDFPRLLNDPNNLTQKLIDHIDSFREEPHPQRGVRSIHFDALEATWQRLFTASPSRP